MLKVLTNYSRKTPRSQQSLSKWYIKNQSYKESLKILQRWHWILKCMFYKFTFLIFHEHNFISKRILKQYFLKNVLILIKYLKKSTLLTPEVFEIIFLKKSSRVINRSLKNIILKSILTEDLKMISDVIKFFLKKAPS